RRHTRFSRDWSSDVCSSDLNAFVKAFKDKYKRSPSMYAAAAYDAGNLLAIAAEKLNGDVADYQAFAKAVREAGDELKSVRGPFKIGRASCRESVAVREEAVG